MPHVSYIGPDGKPWPSATELTKLLPAEWLMAWYKREVKKYGWRGWQRCLAVSSRATRLGTHTHGLVEAALTGVPYTAWLDEKKQILEPERRMKKVRGWVKALVETTARHKVHKVEKKVFNRKLKEHGTVDIVSIDDETNLYFPKDWKTSSSVDDDYAIQLAVYNRCLEAEGVNVAGFGEIERVDKELKSKKAQETGEYHVQVKRFDSLSKYYPLIDALHVIWDYKNRQGPWEKGV